MPRRLLTALVDLLFPPLCCSCKEFIHDGRPLLICDDCLAGVVPLAGPLCPRCGRTYPDGAGGDHVCGPCLTGPPPFAAARGAVVFDGTVRELIHRFKYHGQVTLRRPLARLAIDQLAGFVAHHRPEVIVPVPLHTKRLRHRGFNQAVLLGEALAKEWRLPLQRHNLRRSRWTEPQVNLAAAEREANVKGAFVLAEPALVAGKRVLLVDDVYTTGSTVRECARVLKKGGAAEVVVVTVARALEQG